MYLYQKACFLHDLKHFLFGYVTDEHVLHRKHTHTGSVYGFDFSVQFIVQEEKVISVRVPAYQ